MYYSNTTNVKHIRRNDIVDAVTPQATTLRSETGPCVLSTHSTAFNNWFAQFLDFRMFWFWKDRANPTCKFTRLNMPELLMKFKDTWRGAKGRTQLFKFCWIGSWSYRESQTFTKREGTLVKIMSRKIGSSLRLKIRMAVSGRSWKCTCAKIPRKNTSA